MVVGTMGDKPSHLVEDRVMGEDHDHGMIRGISQDPIGIKVKGIDRECDQSRGVHREGHVVVTKIMGHRMGTHDSENKEI